MTKLSIDWSILDTMSSSGLSFILVFDAITQQRRMVRLKKSQNDIDVELLKSKLETKEFKVHGL